MSETIRIQMMDEFVIVFDSTISVKRRQRFSRFLPFLPQTSHAAAHTPAA